MVAAPATPRGKIGVILPSRETFALRKSGAIALCSRDFANYSRFRDSITIVGAAECEYPDVRYRRLTDWRRWWMRGRTAYANAVVRAALDEAFAVLEIQNRPYTVGLARNRLSGTRFALHLQNDPQTMDGSRTVAERRDLLRRLDAVYCCSEFIRGQFLEGLEDESGKTIVVYNGIAANPVAPPKERIFAFVGRVIPVKGVVELIKAFALAAPQLPEWRLVIAGDDPDGLLSGPRAAVALEREALAGRLTLMGQVSHADAMALYARAEIAVAPSLWQEPFARSAIEAMSNGCALIASARGGLAEVAAGAGEIVEPDDIAAFAATLRRVGSDDDLRRRLQAAGKAKAQEVFDIRRVIEPLDAARARLLATHCRRSPLS
jgi:glycosyltransferase involved in cell wall biosynthesis